VAPQKESASTEVNMDSFKGIALGLCFISAMIL